MAADASVNTTLDRARRTLTIRGTDQADSVSIIQNDTARTVTVATGPRGGNTTTTSFDARLVDRLIVSLDAGDDQFSFATVGEVRSQKDLRINLGEGDDDAVIRWADDRSSARASLRVFLEGESGSDAVGVRIGALRSFTSAYVIASLGDGNDAFFSQVLNPNDKSGFIRIDAFGAAGDDELQHEGSGVMGRDAQVWVQLNGGAGDDQLDLNQKGAVDGRFVGQLQGGSGDDEIIAALVNRSGRGRATLNANGGQGNDSFVVDVRDSSGPAYTVTSRVDGGEGVDSIISSDATQTKNVETQEPINEQTRPGPTESFYPELPTSVMITSDPSGGTRNVEFWANQPQSNGTMDPSDPLIVLVPGAGASIDSWTTIAESLARVGRVIAVNKPGYGKSSPVVDTSTDYNVQVIEDIRSVVAKLALGRQIILVGQSIGGAYANLFARLYPQEVAGVVFVDGTAPVPVNPDDLRPTYETPLLRIAPAGYRQEYQGLANSINAQLDANDEFPMIPVIALAPVRSELENGLAQQLADLGDPGTLRLVEHAGHYLHADQPQAVVTAIRDVLSKTQLSGILADIVEKYGIPGLSASVIVGNRVTSGVAGVRASTSTNAVQIADRFGIGSTTKAMTATLAGILVERGILKWESTISELFPELQDQMRPEYRNVTIEQLFQHRGGIVADEDASEELAAKIIGYQGPAEQSRLALLPEILKEPAPVSIGTFRYANGGYAVAAAMMERATGLSYERLMQSYIFDPLGMNSATFHPPVSDPNNPAQPMGHRRDGTPAPGDRTEVDYLTNVLRPAGAELRMNIADWSKLIRIHLGQSVNGVRLVNAETLERLHKPVQIEDVIAGVGYAMGWGVLEPGLASDPRLGINLNHLGSDGNWLAGVTAFPQVGFSMQVMANAIVDKNGADLESTAFAELSQRVSRRFGPALPTT